MRQLTTHPSATSIPDETPFTDYLSTGQTVGEVAFLTSVKRSAVARCDTSVQLYHVLYEAVQVKFVCIKDRGALNLSWGLPDNHSAAYILRLLTTSSGELFSFWKQTKYWTENSCLTCFHPNSLRSRNVQQNVRETHFSTP